MFESPNRDRNRPLLLLRRQEGFLFTQRGVLLTCSSLLDDTREYSPFIAGI